MQLLANILNSEVIFWFIQGYFQCLFSCIERLLQSLSVKNLVLPAADEAESIWTNKFGFTKLEHDEVCNILCCFLVILFTTRYTNFMSSLFQINNYKKFYHMMIFQGTSVLQRPVPTLPSTSQEIV